MSSSSSPCAACKLLRRKCTQGCVFAPYFPPDQPLRFANVHKVFGASNVSKLLNDLPQSQREQAVESLVYEAEARLRDPVYGCVGYISILQHRIKQMQEDILTARQELATYVGSDTLPQALGAGIHQQHMASSQYMAATVHQQHMASSQHMAATVKEQRQQEMMMMQQGYGVPRGSDEGASSYLIQQQPPASALQYSRLDQQSSGTHIDMAHYMDGSDQGTGSAAPPA